MDILIQRTRERLYKDVHWKATSIPYLHRIQWYGSDEETCPDQHNFVGRLTDEAMRLCGR